MSENVKTIELGFLIFLLYAFLGWVMETIYCFLKTKKWIDRGFLIGPVCPIYGFGCLFIFAFLQKYFNDPIVLFVLIVVICSVLEYFTSYLMEKLFKARWWDYSNKNFNLNGRICLGNLLAFGLGGMMVVYLMQPLVNKLMSKLTGVLLHVLCISLGIVFIVDVVISSIIIIGFKKTAKTIRKDSTEEITKAVRKILMERGGLYKRLVSAFNFEASEKLLREISTKVKSGAEKAKIKLQEETLKKEREIRQIKNYYNDKIKKLEEKVKIEKLKEKRKNSKVK